MSNIFQILIYIGFFLFCLRVTFFWVYIWQTCDYQLRRIFVHLNNFSLSKTLRFALLPTVIILLIVLYGVVVFLDSFSLWYKLIVGLFFVFGGLNFIVKIYQGKILRPIFDGKAFVISLLTTFTFSFFSIIPLADTFVWLLILCIFLPLFTTLYVVLLSFPSEIYIDYITESLIKKLNKNKTIYIIAIIGKNSFITKKIMYELISSSFICLKTERANSFSTIVYEMYKNYKKQEIFIYNIDFIKHEEAKKIIRVINPNLCILTNLNDVDEKNAEEYYKELMNLFSKKTMIMSSVKNDFILNKTRKRIYTYSMQKNYNNKNITIIGFDKKIKNGMITWKVKIKNNILNFKTKFNNENLIYNFLPSIYIAFKLGIPIRRIQNVIREFS